MNKKKPRQLIHISENETSLLEKPQKTKGTLDQKEKTPRKRTKKNNSVKEDVSTDESMIVFDSKANKENENSFQKASPNFYINALMIYSGALDLKTPPKKIRFRKEKKQQLLRPILKFSPFDLPFSHLVSLPK